ncbi:hypothetical protein [Bdellovibrio sp. BCCA]|uniref:hypothetical protein n=1 Tax=Bdellovibrio sp. BCCA TaxID=3136281 RepID=UPI0030F2BBAD
MEFNELVTKFLDEVCAKDTSTSKCLSGSEVLVHELAQVCRNTEAFKSRTKEFEEMRDVFSLNVSGKNFAKNAEVKLELAWKHFVDRLNGAPTSVHARMVVILVMPIISDFLRESKEIA